MCHGFVQKVKTLFFENLQAVLRIVNDLFWEIPRFKIPFKYFRTCKPLRVII